MWKKKKVWFRAAEYIQVSEEKRQISNMCLLDSGWLEIRATLIKILKQLYQILHGLLLLYKPCTTEQENRKNDYNEC